MLRAHLLFHLLIVAQSFGIFFSIKQKYFKQYINRQAKYKCVYTLTPFQCDLKHFRSLERNERPIYIRAMAGFNTPTVIQRVLDILG